VENSQKALVSLIVCFISYHNPWQSRGHSSKWSEACYQSR